MKPRMMRVVQCALVCFFLFAINAEAQTRLSDMKSGAYHVGFKVLFAYDDSRPAIADEAGFGMSYIGKKGRQIPICVWYPAQTGRTGRPMRFADYVDLLGRDLDFGPLTEEKKRHGLEKFIGNIVELGGDEKITREKMPELMKLQAWAIKDAPAAGGKFPLVVFPDYRSPATNTIICEYLASHGFVVVSIPLRGTEDADFDAGITGIETLAADLQFVIGQMRKDAMVDRSKLALMGVGISASSCLVVLTRNREVDALVSLDGGIPTRFEDDFLKLTPFFDIASIRAPILAIHAPHPNLDMTILDQYKYSTRYYVHFPQMSEFHFLNYGVLEKRIPSIIGKSPGDTKTGFEWACLYTMNFLKAYLKDDIGSLEFLQKAPDENLAPAGLVSSTKREALKAPPTLAEMKAMFRAAGINRIVEVYRELKRSDPQPFTLKRFRAFNSWLAWGRDPDFRARDAFSELMADSHPGSALAHYNFAQALKRAGNREQAIRHYREALRLLDEDRDPLLDEHTRRQLKDRANESLKNFGAEPEQGAD